MNRSKSMGWFCGVALCVGTAGAAAQTVDTTLKVASLPLSTSDRIDGFIVHYKPGTRAPSTTAVQAFTAARSLVAAKTATLSTNALRAASFRFARATASGGMVVRAGKALDGTAAMALMKQVAADPNVESVEPNVRMHAFRDIRPADATTGTPNDPSFSYQWHFRAGDGTMETIGKDTQSFANYGGSNAVKAWSLAQGDGVVVAVIDTGATQHPDLDTSLTDQSYDFISDAFVSGRAADGRARGAWDQGDWTTGDTYLASNGGCVDYTSVQPEDSSWHGTHVMGNVAELTDNGVGMAGVAYKARVLPVRALGHCGGSTSDIADAVVWAAGGHVDGLDDNTHPAQVINMSLGGGGACNASTDLGKAIATAIDRGATVVVAAGNSGEDAANTSPANCPGVITVASNGITGKPAFYSNYGSVVTLSAPGGGGYANDASSGTLVAAGFAWSAINAGTTVPSTPTYGSMAGTSQATPEVAGAVALMISARAKAGLATLTPGQIKTYLARTARAFPQRPSQAYGAGILDTYAAVQRAMVVSDPTADAIALVNGVPTKYQGDGTASEVLFKLVVPAKARGLTLRTLGGSGDVTLLVSKDTAPSVASAQYTSAHVGNNESVTINNAAPGTYYLLVTGITGGTTFSAMGLYTQ
ncbi:S8 family serine peptidase [Luteibacter sp. PPL201]|uniref:S8 family serine peptidase n=1 Tax=Luteibacter sahnii TaxID=3021977 RepID=A0ABT6BCA4_9GAMM